jgi:XTP/dITP diphosphohydrolase
LSARFAGAQGDDAANNLKLVNALKGLPKASRRARYRCVLVLMREPQDPAPLVAEGVWEGEILDAPRGTRGFGYDPYFFLPELGLTAAELDPADKNRLSHRGTAMLDLRRRL